MVFRSRLIRPAEAVLVLVGVRSAFDPRNPGSTVGTTMVFLLRTAVDGISPISTLKVETPCYELQTITLPVSMIYITK